MKESSRTWLILAVLALIVALLYYLLEVRGIAPPSESEEEYVWDLEASQIVGVRVVDNGSGAVTALARTGEREWQVTESVTGTQMANLSDVVSLNQTLARMRVSHTIEEPPEEEIEVYGLITPTYTVEVQVEGGQAFRLDVGVEGLGSAYFVRREGEKAVLLVPGYAIERVVGIVAAPPIQEPATPTPGLPVVGPSQSEEP